MSDLDAIALGQPDGARVLIGPPTVGHLPVNLRGRYIEAGDVVPLDPSLADFFRQLDAEWRGWVGARTWTSTGGGCTIQARHDGVGHVAVVVSLHEPGMGREPVEPWTASLGVLVDISELSAIARKLGDFDG